MSPETFDTWIGRVTRLVALLIGTTMEVYETFVDKGQRAYIIIAGIGLLAGALSGVIERRLLGGEK